MDNALSLKRYTQEGDALKAWSEVEASTEAVRLYALCNSPYPSGQTKLINIVLKDVLNTAFRFAVHARRVLEIEGNVDSEVGPTGVENYLTREHGQSFSFEKNLRKAISKIIHARKIAVLTDRGNARGNSILKFEEADMVVAFEIKSDHGKKFHVSPQGVAWGYLNRGQSA